MAALNVQSPKPLAPAAITYAAATSGGDSIPAYDGKTWLDFKNGSGSPITVTVHAQVPCNTGGILHDATFTVPASGELPCGPFGAAFLDANGALQITYSGVTTLTVAAIRTA